ncbi:hypothetical protein ABHI18_002519, partial [Aspergillus niger]
MAPSQKRVKQEQLRKRRNNLLRRINDFWRLYAIRSWVILEMPNRRIYTYHSHPHLPAPTAEQLDEWPEPVVRRTPADYTSQSVTDVVVPRPPTFNILGRRSGSWIYAFSKSSVYNDDLVQRQIDSQGGAIAFVDDFTAWVTGPTAQSNREGIEASINKALDWEKRSGATFEADKTAIIHFTPKAYKSDRGPFTIKGQTVEPKDHVKILGVLMDTSLKYKEHIARAASKGLEAVMELRRLRGLSPSTARQLFTSTVAPVVDYASNVWMHAIKNKATGPINRVQRVGAQAIVGTFLTVATSVAEAEAHIATAQHRFWRRAVKMWTDLHTLPDTNPLRRNTARIRKFRRFHRSPLYQVAAAPKNIEMETLETINPFTLAPWETIWGSNREAATSILKTEIEDLLDDIGRKIRVKSILRRASGYSSYIERAGGTGMFQAQVSHKQQSGGAHFQNPRQQSGQEFVCQTYKLMNRLRRKGNHIKILWVPASEDNKLLGLAKEQARAATHEDATPQAQVSRMKSTTLNLARSQAATTKAFARG